MVGSTHLGNLQAAFNRAPEQMFPVIQFSQLEVISVSERPLPVVKLQSRRETTLEILTPSTLTILPEPKIVITKSSRAQEIGNRSRKLDDEECGVFAPHAGAHDEGAQEGHPLQGRSRPKIYGQGSWSADAKMIFSQFTNLAQDHIAGPLFRQAKQVKH